MAEAAFGAFALRPERRAAGLVTLSVRCNRMKIAVWHNLPSGGGKRALYYHARGLVQRGHFVEAWCPPTSNRNYLPLGEFITEHVLPLDVRKPRAHGLLARNERIRDQTHNMLMAQIRA